MSLLCDCPWPNGPVRQDGCDRRTITDLTAERDAAVRRAVLAEAGEAALWLGVLDNAVARRRGAATRRGESARCRRERTAQFRVRRVV